MAILKLRDKNGNIIDIPSIRGKSAYEYAQEGGYTGTEADFIKDLAESGLSDIIDNLTTNASDKPLSAKQGVQLKALIDAIVVPTKTSQLQNDSGFLTQHQSLSGYAKTENHYTKAESDNKYQPKGSYATQTSVDNLQETIDNLDNEVAHYITPEMFGAKGDGVTDDSAAIQTAIQTAIDTATNAHYLKPIVYLADKTYKIDTSIILESRCLQFRCDGILEYSGADVAVSVKHSLMDIYINKIKAPNGTALHLTGAEHQCVTNNIKVNRIEESVKGLYLHNHGEANSMFYNQINIGSINSIEKCVELSSELGYINENHFWFGKLGGAEIGIKIYSDATASGTGAGGNRFFKGSFEDLANTDQDDSLMADANTVALWLENTDYNTFSNFRCEENYGRTNVKFVGKCTGNDIGLSHVQLGGIDITELTAGGTNRLSGYCQTGSVLGGGYNVGNEVLVSYDKGITYNPIYANIWHEITSDSFTDNVIKQVSKDDTLEIITTFTFNDSVNGKTYTLGALYSEFGSLCKGFPLVFKFDSTNGRIILKDNRGGIIFNNSNGKYTNTSISVKWNGFDKVLNKNIWYIQELGVESENVANKVTEVSISSTDKEYPTAKCVYEAIKANKAETLTFRLKEGHLVITPKTNYTDLVASAIDTDGTIYKGSGYADGYRINSSGVQVAQTGTAITGWMNCLNISDADTILIKGLELDDTLYCGIAFYDKDFSLLHCLRLNQNGEVHMIHQVNEVVFTGGSKNTVTDGIIVIDLNFNENQCALTPPKYFRVFAKGQGSDAIITINEEITETSEEVSLDLNIPTKTSQLTNDSGLATETYVKNYSQPKGTYLTSIPSDIANHKDDMSMHIVYGVCDTAADVADKTVTVDENFALKEGATVIIRFVNANSIAAPTLNVNGTGAKPMYRYGTTTLSTGTTTTGWIAGAIQMFTYDGTGWIRDYWNNTTYSNASLGSGYATCSTAEATVAKTATLSSYSLTTGGMVAVKFTNAVPAKATLNINSKGAKNIYYRGAAITADVIKAGDIATFVYSSQYHLISIDRMNTEEWTFTLEDGSTVTKKVVLA